MFMVDTANPNVIAGSLVLILPLVVGLLAFAWRSLNIWERLLALVFVLTGGVMLLLTQSRGAWIAFGFALMILIILSIRWGWVVALVMVVVGIYLTAAFGFDRVIGILASGTNLLGLTGRLEVWSRALYMIQDFHFTGIGMGAFTEVADRLYPFFLYAPGTIEHAHNPFFQVGINLGLPGLVAWLAVFFGSIYSAWRTMHKGKSQGNAWLLGLGAGLLAAQAALVVHGLTDAVTWGMVRSAPVVWLIWGFCAAVVG